MTISRIARRSRLAGWTAMSTPWVAASSASSAREAVGVGTGDVQVDRGDRVARHPLDPVDVGAGVGDPPGDRGHRRRLQRVPDHGHVRAAFASAPVVAGCRGRPRRASRARRRSPRRRPAASSSRGGAVTRMPRIRRRRSTICSMSSTSTPARVSVREHRRGDAGPVLPGDGQQQGLRRLLRHGGSRLPRSGPTVGARPYRVADGRHVSIPSSHLRLRRAGRPRPRGRQGVLRRRLRLVVHRLRPRLRRHPPSRRRGRDGRAQPRATGRARAAPRRALQRRPRRHARGGAGGRGDDRRGAVRVPGRSAVPLHRPGRQRAGGLDQA